MPTLQQKFEAMSEEHMQHVRCGDLRQWIEALPPEDALSRAFKGLIYNAELLDVLPLRFMVTHASGGEERVIRTIVSSALAAAVVQPNVADRATAMRISGWMMVFCCALAIVEAGSKP